MSKLYARRFNATELLAVHDTHDDALCNWEYEGKVDAQMAVMTNCRDAAQVVLAYRYGMLEPWRYIAYCERHGGLLKAETKFLELAKEQTIHWEDHDRAEP